VDAASLPWWAWLLPATYGLHIIEEAWAGEGFGRWIRHVIRRTVRPRWFFAVNAVLWLAMVAAVASLRDGHRAVLLAAALGVIVTVNGVGHLVGTVVTRVYSPGLVSGLLLWAPLGLATLRWSWIAGPASVWYAGLLSGILLQACLGALALALSDAETA
jgi:hypothetical protein